MRSKRIKNDDLKIRKNPLIAHTPHHFPLYGIFWSKQYFACLSWGQKTNAKWTNKSYISAAFNLRRRMIFLFHSRCPSIINIKEGKDLKIMGIKHHCYLSVWWSTNYKPATNAHSHNKLQSGYWIQAKLWSKTRFDRPQPPTHPPKLWIWISIVLDAQVWWDSEWD